MLSIPCIACFLPIIQATLFFSLNLNRYGHGRTGRTIAAGPAVMMSNKQHASEHIDQYVSPHI